MASDGARGILDDPELEHLSGRGFSLRPVANFVLFCIFIVAFTVDSVAYWDSNHGGFARYLERRCEEGPTKLSTVNSAKLFYTFLNTTISDFLYLQHYNSSGLGVPDVGVLPVDDKNFIVGAVRVRMMKVLPNTGCEMGAVYRDLYRYCYPAWGAGLEDRATFGNPDAFVHTVDDEGSSYSGELDRYGPNGFMQYLTTNRTRTGEIVWTMERQGYVTVATRAIFLDFTVWSRDIATYGVVRILFELGPSGTWTNTLRVLPVDSFSIQPTIDTMPVGRALTFALLLAFVLFYAAEELSEFCVAKVEYFRDGWNLLDWVNLILLFVSLMHRALAIAQAGGARFGLRELADPGFYQDAFTLAESVHFVRTLNAFNSVLLWVKVVKYARFLPFVKLFALTIKTAWQAFVSFAFIFIFLFVGFSVSFTVSFGNRLPQLASFGKTLIFLSRSFLGDTDTSVIYESHNLLGGSLLLMFIVGIVLILFNIGRGMFVNSFSEAIGGAEYAKMVNEGADTRRRISAGFWSTFNHWYVQLRMDRKFRQLVPGLYARVMYRRKIARERNTARLQLRRDREDLLATLERVEDEVKEKPRPVATTGAVVRAVAAVEKKEDHEEVDLGPLTFKVNGGKGFGNSTRRGQLAIGSGAAPDTSRSWSPRRKPIGKKGKVTVDLFLDATRTVANNLLVMMEKVSHEVCQEMKEAYTVVSGINDVVEVLNRRAKDLEVQQSQMLVS